MLAGVAGCLVLGFFPLVLGDRVPLLGLVDLGFHELGHLLTYPFPDLFTAMMGSITQVLVPLGIAAYFLWWREDLLAAGLCAAWAGTSFYDVSVYVADAPYEKLQLIGGDHDWAFAFDRLNAVEAADEVALLLKVLAWALVLGGVALCAWRLLSPARPPITEPLPGLSVKPISWDA